MPSDKIHGHAVELIAVDEGEAAWEAVERMRAEKLQAAKQEALTWLDAGDLAGCLVKFVQLTMAPVLEGGRPIVDWFGGSSSLLALGKLYVAPLSAELEPFEHLVAMSSAREDLRRWVVGFR